MLNVSYKLYEVHRSVGERVMGVGHSWHGVNLEVLVWTDASCCFNWTPVSPAGLSIIEPLVGQVLHVITIDVADTGCNFASVDTATDVQELGTDFLVDSLVWLFCKKWVPKVVTATNNLNVINVMTIDSGQASTAVVHLASENLISEEVVTEDSAVTVCEVVGISQSNIGKVSQESVHAVVLLLDVVQVFSVLIDSVWAENVFQQKESVVVLVFDWWSIVHNSNVGVIHFIITNKEQWRSVNSLV